MPTAQDFRTASTDIAQATESVATMHRLLDQNRTNFGFSGTSIAGSVEDSLIAGAANMSVVGQSLNSLIAELDRKARLCEQYTMDMQTHERLDAQWVEDDRSFQASAARGGSATPAGWRPVRPQPPFPGAEAG